MRGVSERNLLLGVLLVAIALRLPTVLWELPGNLHFFSYHPDELPLIGASANLNPASGQLNPGFYNYGTLYLYLLWPAVAMSTTAEGFSVGFATLLGRLLTLAMGVGSVWLVYLTAKRIAGGAAGLFAAGMLAVTPLHVQHSGFVTVDVTATFFVTLCVYLALKGKTGWSGFAAGLAAATKYSCGLAVVIPVLAALIDRKCGLADRAKRAAMAAGTSLGGFLLGCPGALLWHNDFRRGLEFEMNHIRTGHGFVFLETGSGYVYHLLHSLLPAMGWPLLVLSIAALAWALWKRLPWAVPFAGFLAVYYLVIGGAEVRFARYVTPLLPVLAIFSGTFVGWMNPKLRWAGFAAAGLTFVYALLLQQPLTGQDPRTDAAGWLTETQHRGKSIALVSVPWFYSPPLSPMLGALGLEQRRQAAEEVSGWRLIVPESEWDTSVLDERPDMVVMSNFEWQDRKRLGNRQYLAFMEQLEKRYQPERRFGGDPAVRFFTLQSALPHDMQYTFPEIVIYSAK